jgi:thymidylate synthase (FAD)
MGSDLSIVRSARVSYNADWRSGEDAGKDEKLIGYLLKNKHNTPFESVVFTFEVKAPIFVFRQWHRHRTWSFNEVSARYTELDEGFYIPDPSKIGVQSKDNKQVRDIPQDPNVINSLRGPELAANMIRVSCQDSFRMYKQLLEDGVPRELARSVLPVASYSRMFATVDLHNLMHFLRLRLHAHAQYEIRVYAEAMLELVEPICPVAIAAFKESLQ